MTVEWTPIFVLPNIPLREAIGCDIAVLAPPQDPRLAALKHAQPMFRLFLNSFSDTFGEKFEPTVLMLRTDAPPSFRNVSTLASFRDLIAISAVAYNRALQLLYPSGHRVVFGEAFAIHPWMLDKHSEDLIGSTPAILGTHEVANFKGQSSPMLFRTTLGEGGMDQPLLAVLLKHWRRHYEAGVPEWADIALFRSLNMAYHASLLPAGTDTTIYDVGRLISLWISAFEILVHPGGNGQANCDKVFDLIEKTPWAIEESRKLAHDTGGKTKVKRTLASWIYQTLYNCRNNFLHGNPVEPADLILAVSQRPVLQYAAPLYRLALTAFLPLTHDKPVPPDSNVEALGAYIAEKMEFMEPQRCIEEAILTAKEEPRRRTWNSGEAQTGGAALP